MLPLPATKRRSNSFIARLWRDKPLGALGGVVLLLFLVVVADDEPLLQALRTELRPAQPEIDGVLGLSALAATEFDVDYPHNRLLFRCAASACVARPALRDRASRLIVGQCLARAGADGDAGVDAAVDAAIDAP